MAAIIQPQKWGRIKPALGSQIDWGHPIVAGRRLTACYLLNEGGGRPTELVSSRMATSSNALWTPDGLKCNGTSTATYWTNPAGVPVSPPFTVFALVNMVRNTTAAAICGYTLRGGVGGWEFYYEQFNATGFTGFSKINVSSQTSTLPCPTGPTMVAAAVSATGVTFYCRNSRSFTSDAGSILTTVDNFQLGSIARNGADIDFTTGNIHFVGILNKLITNDEWAWLQAEPYTFIQPVGGSANRLWSIPEFSWLPKTRTYGPLLAQ
jgi:hypothetical protein